MFPGQTGQQLRVKFPANSGLFATRVCREAGLMLGHGLAILATLGSVGGPHVGPWAGNIGNAWDGRGASCWAIGWQYWQRLGR